MRMLTRWQGLAGKLAGGLALFAAVLFFAAYSNHFQNGFHFDDSHTVVENLYIRDLANAPRFFTDARTFSSLPTNRSYRPLVSLSFAVDYAFGGGVKPFFFRASTFVWYIVQVFLMFYLYKCIGERCWPEGRPSLIAVMATGLYALHPVGAETINYVSARSDSLSTLAVVAAFVSVQMTSGWRGILTALGFVALGALCKPTAVMFAPMLLVYRLLIDGASWRQIAGQIIVVFSACLAFYGFIAFMTPSSWSAGGTSRLLYIATQPAVTAFYVISLFLPFWLSADTDWQPVASLTDPRGACGLLFLAGLAWVFLRSLRDCRDRPIAFGLAWFALALVPTAAVPLAEVMNDHRMFFPYVGLVFAVVWAVHRLWDRFRFPIAALVGFWVLLLPVCAVGVHQRNLVWRSSLSLWEDVVRKSPRNGRGLMNHGLAFMAEGRFDQARKQFERALALVPDYSFLRVNIGILEAATGNDRKAEEQFLKALSLDPEIPAPNTFYARFLVGRGRPFEAIPLLVRARRVSPGDPLACGLLLQAYAAVGAHDMFHALASETLEICPDDPGLRAVIESAARNCDGGSHAH